MSGYSDLLAKACLFLADKPASDCMPSLPDDPTALPDSVLMDYFFELTEWGCYARAQALDAAVEEKWAERFLAILTAEAIKDLPGKTLADRRSAASLTENVLDADRKYINAWANHRAVNEAADTAERRAAALSRELSRRGAITPRSSRWSP